MKLVLIQGNYMANYEGREQRSVIEAHNWDFDVRAVVETFRTEGAKAFE